MPTKKRFFTRNKKKIPQSRPKNQSIGNTSVKAREFIQQVKFTQNKKETQKTTIIAIEVEKKQEIKRGKQELPNNSQSITETVKSIHVGFPWQKILLILFLAVLFGLSLWQGFIAVQKGILLQSTFSERIKLSQDLQLWENIAEKYPTYRDAYFQAALLAYRLGDSSTEGIYLGKTLQLDPNYQPAQNLEKISR